MSENISSWRKEIAPYVRGCPDPKIDEKVIDICRDLCKRTRLWRKNLTAIDVIAVTASDIAMVNGTSCTITSTSTDFTDVAGDSTDLTFVAGQKVVIENTDDNDKEVTIASGGVAANTLTLETRDVLIDESAGNSVVLSAADYALTSTDGDISEVLRASHDGLDMKPESEEYLDRLEPGWRDMVISDPTRYIVGQDRRIRLVYAPNEELIAGLVVNVALMPLRTATSVEDFLYDDFKDIITHGVLWLLKSLPDMPFSDNKDALGYYNLYRSELKEPFYRGERGYSKANSGGIRA